MVGFVVAVPHLSTPNQDSSRSLGRQESRLGLIHGALSARKVARQSPVLAGFHRIADGSLVGVVLAVALLSGLTLHWQHRWTQAFSRLEATRFLVHRFTDSTAMFERHLLLSTTIPKVMVPTKATNLLYLNRPKSPRTAPIHNPSALFTSLMDQPINHGY